MFSNKKRKNSLGYSSAGIPIAKDLGLSVRRMEGKDLKMVMDWCREEGWNVGKYDAGFYYSLDSMGHFIFLLENQPIGAISIVNYQGKLWTLGPFIVRPEYRGQGYGAYIWQYAMEFLERQPKICFSLYAVPTQISRYANSGFKQKFANQRWQKTLTENGTTPSILETEKSDNIKCLDLHNLKAVSRYDQSIFYASREKLLSSMLQNQYVMGFVSMEKSKVTGFGLIRPCVAGYRVGPLYADTINEAQALFRLLLNAVGNDASTVFLDVPTINPYAERFAEYFNLDRVSEVDTVAMFKGEVPPSLFETAHKQYGLCSLEVG